MIPQYRLLKLGLTPALRLLRLLLLRTAALLGLSADASAAALVSSSSALASWGSQVRSRCTVPAGVHNAWMYRAHWFGA